MDRTNPEYYKTGMTFRYPRGCLWCVLRRCGHAVLMVDEHECLETYNVDQIPALGLVLLPEYPYVGQERRWVPSRKLFTVMCLSDGLCGVYHPAGVEQLLEVTVVKDASNPTIRDHPQETDSFIQRFLDSGGLDDVGRIVFTKAVAEALESDFIKERSS